MMMGFCVRTLPLTAPLFPWPRPLQFPGTCPSHCPIPALLQPLSRLVLLHFQIFPDYRLMSLPINSPTFQNYPYPVELMHLLPSFCRWVLIKVAPFEDFRWNPWGLIVGALPWASKACVALSSPPSSNFSHLYIFVFIFSVFFDTSILSMWVPKFKLKHCWSII